MKRIPTSPRLARRLLEHALPVDAREDIAGDLEEVFRRRCDSNGVGRARLWYWQEAISFAGRFLCERLLERSRSIREPTRTNTPGPNVRRVGVMPAVISWLDVKLGLRMLVKYPALTLIGVVAMSVTVGIAAAIFEFANDILHPTLPLEDGERVVGLRNYDVEAADPDLRSLHDFVTWRDELDSVEDIGAFIRLERNLITGDGRPERVEVAEISASAFLLARVPPLMGRPLVDADERDGAAPVVVIGHRVWQNRFGGDPDVIGRTLQLGSSRHTVVGVMPEGFAFPLNHSLWVPRRRSVLDYERGEGPSMWIFGRLAPGITFDDARAELTAIGVRVAADFPATHEHLRPQVLPYAVSFFDPDPRGMYLSQFFLVLLLVVACVNVATLVFARTATRESEIAVRNALGASRGRVVMQLFVEALVLTSVAALIGLVAADRGLRWVMGVGLGLDGLELANLFWWDASLAPGTILYVAMLTAMGAVIVGVVPALKVTGRRVQSRLRSAAAGGSGLRFGGVWTVVIVGQVAISVFFLPEAISIGREIIQSEALELDFPVQEYLAVRLHMDRATPPSDSIEQAQFLERFGSTYQELEQSLAAEPGVLGVTFASHLPGTDHPRRSIEVDGEAAPLDPDVGRRVNTASVDIDFFGALSTPILSGRAFHSGDIEPDRRVVIVNQSFVRRILGGRNPIGRRIRYVGRPDEEPGPWFEIVGVVRDLGMNPIDPGEAAGLYHPLVPIDAYPLRMAIHVGRDAASFAPRLRSIGIAVDPTLRLEVQTLDRLGSLAQQMLKLFVAVLGVLASIALALAAAGIYSLMSFTVSRRTREIGIRAALGAHPRRILIAIFSRAFAQIGLGVVAGGFAAAFLGNQISTEGPGLLLAVAALMMTVGLLACAVPAIRALRIQPTDALREGV